MTIEPEPRQPPGFRPGGVVSSRDRTPIAWFTAGPARSSQPVLALVGSVGAARTAFTPLLDQLDDRRRFVGFDFRGTGASGPPAKGDLSIERHVEDLAAVLDAEGAGATTLIGWGVGAQIALAFACSAPERCRGLVLISPLAGPPRALRPLLDVARRLPGRVERALRAASFDKGGAALRRLGLLRPSVTSDTFAEVYAPMGGLDLEWMLKMREAAVSHDARQLLSHLEIPTLLVAGDRDRLAPFGYAQQMVRRLPRAEILVARGGTHFALLEFPELIALRLEQFLRERELTEPVARPGSDDAAVS